MKSVEAYYEKVSELGHSTLLYTSAYNFDGFMVEVQCNDHKLLVALDEYFHAFIYEDPVQLHARVIAIEDETEDLDFEMVIHQPDPGKTKFKEKFKSESGMLLVHKIKTGVNFLFNGSQRYAHGPLIKNVNQLINLINNLKLDRLLEKGLGQIFHAAGVCRGEIGLGLAGSSGKGKSTLCLKLLGDDVNFVSNDRLIVDVFNGQLMMHGIPKYPRVNPGTILNQENIKSILSPEEQKTYGKMSLEELWPIEKKYDVKIEQYYQNCEFILNAEMKYFLILNWDHDSTEETEVREIKISEHLNLLPTVMKSPGLMLPNSQSRLTPLKEENYIGLLDRCTLLELRGKVDFDRAKELIMTYLYHGIKFY